MKKANGSKHRSDNHKSKRTAPRRTRGAEDPIFGIVDESAEQEVLEIERQQRAAVTRRKASKQQPPLKVNYGKVEGLDKVRAENLVEIPDSLLKAVLDRTQKLTTVFSRQMLCTEVPPVLAFDAASAYVEAAMRDGLGTETEIEDDVLKCLDNINKLSAIYQFVKHSSLPRGYKRRFFAKLIDQLAAESVESMKKAETSRKYSQKLRNLSGIVKSRHDVTIEPQMDPKPEEGKKSGKPVGRVGTQRRRT